MGGCPSANANSSTAMPTVSAFHAQPKKVAALESKEKQMEKGLGLNSNHNNGNVLARGVYREFNQQLEYRMLLEHYQPPEFPPVPVIGRETNELTNSSWKSISSREYDDPDAPSGKVKGAVYFYNTFFRLLFDKSTDFKTKFPTVQSQASVMSKVMSLCLSIEFDKLDLQTMQLQDLGRKHQFIVQDPWQYAIYATTLHSALKICLGDEASPIVMSAWLHVFSFVLRTMLPTAITPTHIRVYAGAVNATTLLNDDDQAAIKNQSEFRSMKSDLASLNQPSALKGSRARLAAAANAAAVAGAGFGLAGSQLEHSVTATHNKGSGFPLHNPEHNGGGGEGLDDITDAKEFNEKQQERERLAAQAGGGSGALPVTGGVNALDSAKGTPNTIGAQAVTVRISGVTGQGSGRRDATNDSPKLKPHGARVNSITSMVTIPKPTGDSTLNGGGNATTGSQPGGTPIGGARANAYRAVHSTPSPGVSPGAQPIAAFAATGSPGPL